MESFFQGGVFQFESDFFQNVLLYGVLQLLFESKGADFQEVVEGEDLRDVVTVLFAVGEGFLQEGFSALQDLQFVLLNVFGFFDDEQGENVLQFHFELEDLLVEGGEFFQELFSILVQNHLFQESEEHLV